MKGLSVDKEVVQQAVQHATTYKEVAEALGRFPGHYFIVQLKSWITKYNIDDSHLSSNASATRWSKHNIVAAVRESQSYTEVLVKLGVKHRSGNFTTLKRKLSQFNINVAHFDSYGSGERRKQANGNRIKISLDEILAGKHPTYRTTYLKHRLIAANIKTHQCEQCGLVEWNGAPLTLDLDHINGKSTDHRLQNLRLLCPNCHSQTPTFKGRNKKYAA